VIWTGSDDGLVQLTRDGGATWKNVTPKGLAECLINAIEISPFEKGTAYIATTRYKFNDFTPGLYKTTDYGESWTRIDKGIPAGAFTRVVREDEGRKDLLFAGTELGLYVSWNGGKDWSPFQLNLPVTPITDLKIHNGNLIAATSGRGLWILDDLALIRQYQADGADLAIFKPSGTYLVNGGSELDDSNDEFRGAALTRGVNPASGMVLYYRLPKLEKSDSVTLEIRDAAGNLVRSFSAKKDTSFKKWDGGPPAEPVLSASQGLNRFVWDLRYPTMAGVPGVYIEASYAGHKASPGTYRLTLKSGSRTVTTDGDILANPLYTTDSASYAEYHAFMSGAEHELTVMHETVNKLAAIQERLAATLSSMAPDKNAELRKEGDALVAKLKAWDADMVSRKTKAYDDTENFPQKFTANWLFMINATESDLPRVNQPSRDRMAELEKEWSALKARSEALLNVEIPAFNKKLWDAGVGALGKRNDLIP
jgi:hypothetical protein